MSLFLPVEGVFLLFFLALLWLLLLLLLIWTEVKSEEVETKNWYQELLQRQNWTMRFTWIPTKGNSTRKHRQINGNHVEYQELIADISQSKEFQQKEREYLHHKN